MRPLEAEVERRLLAGENRVEVQSSSGHRIAYVVPSWRRAPITRARIELLRRRAR